MVSEIQLLANRENGKKGGVKTEGGKAISSQNAITHGILSKQVLLHCESARELNKLRSDLMADKKPEGAMEILLVQLRQLLRNLWVLMQMQ